MMESNVKNKPRILAVDDEPRGVELVRRILRRSAEVETATSGDEAWAAFLAGSFDLVISDQRMPGMTGVQLLARVTERSSTTGRILLTGYADSMATVDAINQAHVHAYLSKPCPPDQLSLTVQSVLERMEMLRENERMANRLRSREGDGSLVDGAVQELLEWTERLLAETAELGLNLEKTGPAAGERLRRLTEAGERVASLVETLEKLRR